MQMQQHRPPPRFQEPLALYTESLGFSTVLVVEHGTRGWARLC